MAVAGSPVACEIKDLSLAEGGKRRIEWTFQSMPVLASIRKHFIKTQTFSGVKIAALLPVTAAAANLIITLRDGGAKIALCGAPRHTIEDDVAASLVKDYLVPVFASSAAEDESRAAWLENLLGRAPQLLFDQTGDLTAAAAGNEQGRTSILGATVETREGARCVRALAKNGSLAFPIFASHNSLTRRIFHSRIGAAQTTVAAAADSLNILIAGLHVVVVGFGASGRGIALCAKALGASVVVTEVDPIRALEAAMEGYRVLSMAEAAAVGEMFFLASGSRNVISREHFDKLRNGAILVAAGHSHVEIDVATLAQIAGSRRTVRPQVEEIVMRDGRRVYLLAGGRSMHTEVNDRYSSSLLDLSFANRALAAEYLLNNRGALAAEVYPIPLEIDRQVAKLKLECMGINIDRLTVEQEQYLASSRD